MKYRMIIVDDEEKIIQLIRQLGHWEELGIEVAAVCMDGEAALKEIRSQQPDIVLTDIKMPEMDGIELIERAKELNPNICFVVLSGYRHFEYARSAVQLGVADYLLKPLEEAQLNLTLEKLCRKIDEQRRQEKDRNRLEQYMELDKRAAQEQFWKIIKENGTQGDGRFQSWESCLAGFQMNFDKEMFQCVQFVTNIDGLLFGQQSLFGEKLEEICEKILGDNCRYVSGMVEDGHYGLILNFDRGMEERMRQSVSALFYQIRELADIYGDFGLYIGKSEYKKELCQLGRAWWEAGVAAWGRLVFLGNRIIDYEQVKSLERFSCEDMMTKKMEGELLGAAETFQYDVIGRIFGEISENAVKFRNAHPEDMIRFLQELTAKLLQGWMEMPELMQQCRRELSLALRGAKSFPQTIREYYLCFNDHLHKRKGELERKMGSAVEQAVSYISTHYAESISLESMAERNHLSPAYFSKLFKTTMGVTFVEYVTRVRMEEAKKRLIESRDSIKEIAWQVGYQDDKHFLKTFKKQVGISPKEYRKLYAG